MIKHPKLMEICRERKIALEVCPISFVVSFAYLCDKPRLKQRTFTGMKFWYGPLSSFNLTDATFIAFDRPPVS